MTGYRRDRRRWARPSLTQRSRWRWFWDLALMVIFFALVALLAAKLNMRPPAELLAGKAYVIDGDTISIAGNHVRLKGIDAPELAQDCGDGAAQTACGKISRQALIKIVGGREVRCEASGRDKYNRSVAICYVGETNLNRAMVEAGQAVAYGDYHDTQAEAARAHKGLWASRFETPQDWRREHEAMPAETETIRSPSIADQVYAWLDRLLGGLW